MTVKILPGDCRHILPTLADESVHCVVTSPPYFGLRDYGVAGQIGIEATPDEYVAALVDVFRDVRRVLRTDGTVWCNLGDSYNTSGGVNNNGTNGNGGPSDFGAAQGKSKRFSQLGRLSGLKPKDLIGIPWRVAFALQADGWYLRQDIIWSKPNPMPESVRDRCTKAHEYLFLLSKSERYYYDAEAIKEDGCLRQSGNTQHKYITDDPLHRTKAGFLDMRQSVYEKVNKRSVWEIATQPYADAHFATFPSALIEPCIKAGTSEKGCCAKCGAPWGREVERTRTNQSGSGRAGNPPEGKGGPNAQHAGTMQDIRMGPTISTETIGWWPSCSCNAAVVPCTVLDPFAGAGTTGLVADRLQRNAVLIELSPTYANMAEGRIKGDAPLFWSTAAE